MKHHDENIDEIMAYLEGSLSHEAKRDFEAGLASSPALRRQLDGLASLERDLEAVGARAIQGLPEVDLVASVMAQIAALEKMPEQAIEPETLIAYLDGALSPDSPEALACNAAGLSDAFASEIAGLKATVSDLEQLGAEFKARAPKIDIVAAVMLEVSGAERTPTIVPFPARGRSWRVTAGRLAIAAAAVCALALAYHMTRDTQPAGPRLAGPTVPLNDPDPTAPRPIEPGNIMPGNQEVRVAATGDPLTSVTDFNPDLAFAWDSIGVDAVMSATRAASGGDANAREQLRQWASLADKADSLLASPGATDEGIVAAAISLPPAEAREALLRVVGDRAPAPAVRFAFARTSLIGAQEPGVAENDIYSLREIDPDNALPYYMEAKLRLEQQDIAGALELLREARGKTHASAYGLETASYRKQGLIDSGLDPAAATMLAALTAGMDEHDFLCDLGKDLLQYGELYAEQGEVPVAQEIAEAVRQLGSQLNTGAPLVQEQLAGLDLQRDAIVALQRLYGQFELTGIEDLTLQAEQLTRGFGELGKFFSELDKFFATVSDAGVWEQWAGFILGSGDAGLFEQFQQTGTSVENMVQ